MAQPIALTPLARVADFFTEEPGKRPGYGVLIGVVGLVWIATHIIQIMDYVLPSGEFKALHVGGAVMLICLGVAQKSAARWARWLHLGLGLAAALFVGYVFREHQNLTGNRSFLPNTTDFWFAFFFLLLCLYASLREWGWVVSSIAVIGLLYGYFGQLFPDGLLYHGGISLKRLVGITSIPYFDGLLGSLAELSAGTILPFMLLAAALQATGSVSFIMSFAYRIGGRTRAGPAQVAIISSGFMGMVSGSSVANVASTGALTIPLMKRVGFKGEFAAAVEAVASTGGQITPPVMGLAAFLIVGLTGIPYGEVVIAAIFPALIYYLYLMLAVHLRAAKYGLDASADEALRTEMGVDDEPLWRSCLYNAHFFIAIIYLIWTLLETNLAGRTSLKATALLMTLFALREILLRWRTVGDIATGILRLIGRTAALGAISAAQIAVVVAVIGVLVDILTTTGFAQKLSFSMLELAGGNLWLLLIVAALACLAFGLGLPTSASYILVALMGAPALVSLGVPLIAAHFFVFFFANISAITPPVAVCCLVAAKIAQSGFFRTSFIAVRLGLPGFVLPFLFVIHPEILGVDASLGYTVFVSAMALVGVASLNIIIEGWLLTRIGILERLALLPAAGGLLHPELWTSLVGAALFAAVVVYQLRKRASGQPVGGGAL
jgi:TRAP transporter 4TM/12TM fusion protein